MILYAGLLAVTCISYYLVSKVHTVHRITMEIGNYKFKKKKSVVHNKAFFIVFLILSLFSAIRDGIGIDYASYMIHIKNIQLGYPNYMEIGFQALVKWSAYIDSNPRFVIIICAILTCYFYLRAIFEQSKDILFSLFIFITWGYYFLTFNTIRNYLALAIVLYALKYMKKEQYLHFIILVILASLFHKSALICIPIYLFATRKLKPIHYISLTAIAACALVFKNWIRQFFFIFYAHYEHSVYDVGDISLLNILKGVAIVVLGFIFYKNFEKDNDSVLLFHLNFFSLLFYTAFYWTPEISRIGFYMNATAIMFLPNLVACMKSSVNKRTLKMGIVIASLVLYILLMQTYYSPTTKLLPYATWVFNGGY